MTKEQEKLYHKVMSSDWGELESLKESIQSGTIRFVLPNIDADGNWSYLREDWDDEDSTYEAPENI